MACDGCNCYFSFWAIFCHFTPPPLTAQKIKNFKKMKKKKTPGDFIILHMCTTNYDRTRYGVRQKDGWTDKQKEKVTYRGGCPT